MQTLTRRRIGTVATAIVALLAMPAVVSADTEMGHYGVYGEHRLRDIPGYPGVRCHYGGTTKDIQPLELVVARPPVVFASDTTAEEDIQVVGWRARLQRQELPPGEEEPTAPWQTVKLRPIQKRVATELRPAEFKRQIFAVDSPGRDRFRILVDMYWFDAEGKTIVGGSTHLNDNYRIFIGGEVFLDQARPCHDAQ